MKQGASRHFDIGVGAMARKRMIDPTIWADESFGLLSSDAMIMFMGIISNADDEGRLPGNALYLASTILPYRGLTLKQATTIRDELLSQMKSVILYKVDGKEYIQLQKWLSYQSINKPSSSKYPPLPKDYRSATVGLPPNRIEENRIEKNRTEEENLSDKNTSKNSITPCTPDELVEISETLKVPLDVVERKHQRILEMLETKEFNKRKYKTIFYTLKSWIDLDIQRGFIKKPMGVISI